MMNKFKQWYFKRGVFVCGSDEEIEKAMNIISKHNAKIAGERNIFRKIIIKYAMPPMLKETAKEIYVFKAKNASDAAQMLREFVEGTNGFVNFEHDFVEI